jgi:hypothetical protein
MNNFIVYSHTRLDTNEVFYIGKGKLRRMKAKDNRNKHWTHIANKADFKCDIVAANLSEQEALNFEALLIKKLKEVGVKLCNLASGGKANSGWKMSDEAKQKVSEAKKGKKLSEAHRKELSRVRMGRVVSQATREKLSKAHKGRKPPQTAIDAMSRKVLCIETNTIYPSIKQAAISLNLSAGNIGSCCRGKQKTCGGYHWQYKENT